MEAKELENYDHKKYLLIKNANQNNLKHLNLAIPHNKFVVVTGVSGSGKSSLAFDTIYAEGQRRYIESLSSYIRQFLGKIDKPEVDYIKGLAPAIAIQQKVNASNPRSTVGTSTEIYDYLKLLYARIGKTISPKSGKEVKRHKVEDVLDYLAEEQEGAKFQILAKITKPEDRKWKDEFSVILQKGFPRVQLSGRVMKTEEVLEFLKEPKEARKKFEVDSIDSLFKDAYILIDRLAVKTGDKDYETRLADSVQTAFFEGHGDCIIEVFDSKKEKKQKVFSNRFEEDGISFEEPSVNLFTFNSPYGACPVCEGFGQTIGIDEDKVIPDKTLSLYENAVACWKGEKMHEWRDNFIINSEKHDFPIHRPYTELTEKQKDLLWEGKTGIKGINDFFNYLEKKSYKIQYRVLMARYKGKTKCHSCKGKRLRKEATYVKINNKSISDLVNLSIHKLKTFLDGLELKKKEQQIADRILKEIDLRVSMLLEVGLSYLTMNRPSNTLSGGETQRIQLVTSLGSTLTGSLYILDEPSVGLHSKDNERLVRVLQNLKSLGNSVIVVEHDEEIIRAADELIDIGPAAGSHGGEIVFQGGWDKLKQSNTLTADYLNGKKQISVPNKRRKGKGEISINGAYKHNLKNVEVKIPLEAMTVVSGVSGSGKSTLVREVLFPSLKGNGGDVSVHPHNCKEIELKGGKLSKIEYVDQNPLGKSSRSNPVTYLKAFDSIRELFADQPLSKVSGYSPAYFSFNVDGGRCQNCQGEGSITVEMQFMADIRLTCEECKGKRYKDEILQVTYKEKSIADVLDMTISDSIEFFSEKPNIAKQLQPLVDVGLGYLKLGQPSINLSGGEAQRIKLASFLTKQGSKEPVLFIFDEPTTGLHFHDIQKLLDAFNELIERGHSVLIVEHNMEIIKSADWVIDLGPEGGDEGGNVVFQGTPEGLADTENSYTSGFLKEKLEKGAVH